LAARRSQSVGMAGVFEFVSLVGFVACVYLHSLIFAVLLLGLALAFHTQKDFYKGIASEIERDDFVIHAAGLNPRDFMASNHMREAEGSENPRIYRYYHGKSGNYLFLSLGANFWEWQDDVCRGDPFNPPLGGIVRPGTPCRTLRPVERERALASLGITEPESGRK